MSLLFQSRWLLIYSASIYMDAIQVHVLVFEYRTMSMILVKLRKKKGQQEETGEEKKGGEMAIARFCLINGKVS